MALKDGTDPEDLAEKVRAGIWATHETDDFLGECTDALDALVERLAEVEAALDEVTRLGPRALLAYRRARRRS